MINKNYLNNVFTAAILIAALVIASCGGGGAMSVAGDLSPAPTGNTSPQTQAPADNPASETPTPATPPVVTEDTLGDVRFLPLGTPLPRFPSDVRGTSAVKIASEVIDYSGNDFLTAAGASVEGDTLLLQSSADEIAWAMFQVGGLANREVATFAILTIPQDPETYYRVGFSDYNTALWDFEITSSLPEVQADLTGENSQLVSQLGNLYYVVAVSGGKNVRVRSGHIITTDDGEWGEQWGNDDTWGTPDPQDFTDGEEEWEDDYYDDWYDDWCDNWDDDDEEWDEDDWDYDEDGWYRIGAIEEFGADFIVIDGERLAMDPEVYVLLWDDTEGGSELLENGMWVEVWLDEDANGDLIVVEAYEVPEGWSEEDWDDSYWDDEEGDGNWDDENWDDEEFEDEEWDDEEGDGEWDDEDWDDEEWDDEEWEDDEDDDEF